MGYDTQFSGGFSVDPGDSTIDELRSLIGGLADTRRMKRDLSKVADEKGLVRGHTVEHFGTDGMFYVHDDGAGVVDANTPPGDQPSLWLGWEINDKGNLAWNGEKFHEYILWLEWLVKHVFEPVGAKLNGEIRWRGDNMGDEGILVMTNNKLTMRTL